VVNFDLTVTLGTLIETSVLVAGGVAAFITLRGTVASLKESATATKTETKEQFASVQLELKKLGDILIGQARFDEKLTNLDKRVTTHGRRIDELSRGVGFIRSSRATVDGEYGGE
jgi:hypothetical protein